MRSAVITGQVIDRKGIRESPHQPGTAECACSSSHVTNCSAHGAGSTLPNCVRDSGENHQNHDVVAQSQSSQVNISNGVGLMSSKGITLVQ